MAVSGIAVARILDQCQLQEPARKIIQKLSVNLLGLAWEGGGYPTARWVSQFSARNGAAG
jgi:hypothetical protein